ncbi:hypothetical protein Aduo_019633 [Ancylostoma duodenale]
MRKSSRRQITSLQHSFAGNLFNFGKAEVVFGFVWPLMDDVSDFFQAVHMPDTPSDALWRIVAFAVIMLISGRDRWWIVFVLYSIYRLTRTEMFNRIRQTARRDLK